MPADVITTQQIARLLLLTERRIHQLVRAGILKHAHDPDDGHELRGRFNLVESVAAYIRYLRNELGSDDAVETRYLEGRSRRMVASAQEAELRLGALKGKLHWAQDVEFVMTTMLTSLKSRLLSIPSRVTRLLIGKTVFQEIHDLLQGEIELALRELSEYDPNSFTQANEEYLSQKLFPEPEAAKGNGDHDAPPKG